MNNSHPSDMKQKKTCPDQDHMKARRKRRQADLKSMMAANRDAPRESKFHFRSSESFRICLSHKPNDKCVPKFTPHSTWLRADKQHKLMACMIEKNMSTMLHAIMCFLNDEGAFLEQGRSFDQECTYSLYCGLTQPVHGSIETAERRYGIDAETRKDWKYITFIREPVDRFLSAYVEKCIGSSNSALDYCYGCGANLTCFLSTLYERTYTRPKEISLKEAVADRHYVPQNWLCGFESRLSKYTLIRYSSDPSYQAGISEQLETVLTHQNVSKSSIAYILNQIGGGRTHHASRQSPARAFYENLLRTNKHLMEYMVRIFYWDFVLFGYELPRHFLNYHEPASNER